MALTGKKLHLPVRITGLWKNPQKLRSNPANIYLFKVNNRNTRRCERCEIYSKLTIKTPGRRQELRCGGFIVNFEHISHLDLEFLLFPRRTELQKLVRLYLVANRFLGRYNDILPSCELTLWSANPTKCSNTLKQFVDKLPTNCVSVFDHLWGSRLKD